MIADLEQNAVGVFGLDRFDFRFRLGLGSQTLDLDGRQEFRSGGRFFACSQAMPGGC
jgi:hypothetical protein